MNPGELTASTALLAAATRQGWDGDELADRIQVSRSLVAAWLDGSTQPPERFHRRLMESLDFTEEERAALTGRLPEPEPADPDAFVAALPPPQPPRTGFAMSAGRAIQDARRRKGWTTQELASAIHYTRHEVDSWEDDAEVPWKFAVRAMNEILEFTEEESAAVNATLGS